MSKAAADADRKVAGRWIKVIILVGFELLMMSFRKIKSL